MCAYYDLDGDGSLCTHGDEIAPVCQGVCVRVCVCVCVCVCVLPCRERFTYIVGYRGISMSYGWLSPSKWSRMGCRMSSHSFLYLV